MSYAYSKDQGGSLIDPVALGWTTRRVVHRTAFSDRGRTQHDSPVALVLTRADDVLVVIRGTAYQEEWCVYFPLQAIYTPGIACTGKDLGRGNHASKPWYLLVCRQGQGHGFPLGTTGQVSRLLPWQGSRYMSAC